MDLPGESVPAIPQSALTAAYARHGIARPRILPFVIQSLPPANQAPVRLCYSQGSSMPCQGLCKER